MKLPRYELRTEKSLMVFEFVSEGYKGEIPKIVNFTETSFKELNNKNVQILRIDNSLEKYKNMPIFQEKLDLANEVLRTIGPPAMYFECER